MLSKSNSFHLLRHIHAVIAQKKNNLACSNWRAAFTSLLHIALQLYGAFGKSLSFSAIAFFFHWTRHAVILALPRNLLSGIYSPDSRGTAEYFLLLLLYFFIYFFIYVFACFFTVRLPREDSNKTDESLWPGYGPTKRSFPIASRLSRAKIKCSICSSQFNTWDAQHRWALVLIVCLSRGRRSKLALSRPRVVPVLQYLRVRPTPTTGGYV